jgi:hypothetical protein
MLPAIVSKLFHHFDHTYISGWQDCALALETGDNC